MPSQNLVFFYGNKTISNFRNTAHRGSFYKCTTEECGKQYKTKESIDLHHKTVNHSGVELTGIETKQASCDKDVDDLLEQVEKENEISKSDFDCETCNKSFKTKTLLSRHQSVVHTENRPYSCDSCNLKFKSTVSFEFGYVLRYFIFKLYVADQLEISSSHTYGREKVFVQSLWQIIWLQNLTATSHQNSRRRQAISMPAL